MTEWIGLEQGKALVGHPHCEVGEVINNEGEHDEAAHHHVTRSKASFDVFPLPVRFRPSAAVIDRQANRHVNVNDHGREQKDSNQPEQRAEVAQMLRVTIDPIGA